MQLVIIAKDVRGNKEFQIDCFTGLQDAISIAECMALQPDRYQFVQVVDCFNNPPYWPEGAEHLYPETID